MEGSGRDLACRKYSGMENVTNPAHPSFDAPLTDSQTVTCQGAPGVLKLKPPDSEFSAFSLNLSNPHCIKSFYGKTKLKA